MKDVILLGRGGEIIEVPRVMWEQHLAEAPSDNQERLAFMTENHHRVRYFVVRELPRLGRAVGPDVIADSLDLSLDEVIKILDELEKNLFFLVRDKQGAVSWAYPVTVENTGHRMDFSSGEKLYSA
ncbi:MAG: hypothetical protein GTO18_19510 [Anaerolineales bacterium]|nr:hypothetical protein [Anaerolineales bacterium]